MKTRQTAMLALAAIALMVVPRPAAAGNWVVNSVPDLIAAINAANEAGGDNTIVLAGGTTYTLTAVDNTTSGPNGLPVIAAGNNLTIVGNGATIARSAASKTPAFRFFYVASLYTANGWISLASLTLKDLTLTGGLAQLDTYDSPACGGAIYNYGGALTLDGVRVTGNSAVGSGYVYDWIWKPSPNNPWGKRVWGAVGGQPALGGAIYSCYGSLTLTGGTEINDNSAVGFNNGYAWGGGGYVACATVTLSGVTLSSNTAVGGDSGKAGGFGAVALGGGLYIERGCAGTLTDVKMSSNVAMGGKGKSQGGGEARAGALCVYGYPAGPVTLTNLALSGNAALGGNGAWGGDARGGALAVYCYNVALTGGTLSGNRAVGGDSSGKWAGGGAYGGAIHFMANLFDAFTVTLIEDNITGNSAKGGAGSTNGAAQGGGIYDTWGNAQLDMDPSTYAQTTGNQPDDIYDDIYVKPPLP